MVHRPRTLNARQQLFVNEYLIDMNATQAAIRAGYSKRTAQRTGSENLSKPLISAAIQVALQKRMERIQVDATWVLANAVKVYKKCMKGEAVVDRDGNETGKYRFDSSGALRALELIGRHTRVNAFKTTGDDGQPIDQNWVVRVVHTSKEEFKKISKQ